VPYPDGFEKLAEANLRAQALAVSERLKATGVNASPDLEIIAVIAYLQRLGTDIKAPVVATSMLSSGEVK